MLVSSPKIFYLQYFGVASGSGHDVIIYSLSKPLVILMYHCSEKLHLQFYLEILWSDTGYFEPFGEQSYFVYYRNISYRNIKVYRVETIDMGRSHWKNGVSGTNLISISTMVFIVRDKILW